MVINICTSSKAIEKLQLEHKHLLVFTREILKPNWVEKNIDNKLRESSR